MDLDPPDSAYSPAQAAAVETLLDWWGDHSQEMADTAEDLRKTIEEARQLADKAAEYFLLLAAKHPPPDPLVSLPCPASQTPEPPCHGQ